MMAYRCTRAQNDGEYTEPIPVTELCYGIMFSAMLTDAFQDCDAGFPIGYRFDDKLFTRLKEAAGRI